MSATEGFEEFLAVWEHGSVTAAARALDLPRATLSRRLSAFEEALGVRLLHRTTRAQTLTRAGAALLPRARQVVADARAARAEVARLDDVPRGLLRISIPPVTTESAFLHALIADWVLAWPEVSVEVLTTTRAVDLAAEGFDLALRGGPPREDGLVSRILLRSDAVAAVAPAVADVHGEPSTIEDLQRLPCILALGVGDGADRAWPLRAGGVVRVDGRIATNDLALRRALALAGRGVTVLPRAMIAADLAAGRLRAVLPHLVGATGVLRLVYVERAFLDPKVRSFIDHAVAWLARAPPALDSASPAQSPGASEVDQKIR
jgi:DNA-binding transcriptional LysR family regulator